MSSSPNRHAIYKVLVRRGGHEVRALVVRALAGDIVLCSWARQFNLTVTLSTQVYKWIPANLLLAGNVKGNLGQCSVAEAHARTSTAQQRRAQSNPGTA